MGRGSAGWGNHFAPPRGVGSTPPRAGRAGRRQTPEDAVPTWWTQLPIVSTMLTGWAGGPKNDALSHRRPREILAAAIQSLSHMFGMARDEIERSLQTWQIADWQTDPFSRGAYSYVPVGAGNAREELAQSVDATLFFAGEATHFSGQSGTVAGALASGYRAADEVIDSMNAH